MPGPGGLFPEAMADLNRAARLAPRDPWVYNKRGMVWFCQGEYQKAVDDFSTAIRLAPDSPHAYFFRGNMYRYHLNAAGQGHRRLSEGLRPGKSPVLPGVGEDGDVKVVSSFELLQFMNLRLLLQLSASRPKVDYWVGFSGNSRNDVINVEIYKLKTRNSNFSEETMLVNKWTKGFDPLCPVISLYLGLASWMPGPGPGAAARGGGGSMGSRGSRSSSPPTPYTAPRPTQPSHPALGTPGPTPPPTSQPGSFWRSFGGGMLGGLAGGLLFRSLFGGPGRRHGRQAGAASACSISCCSAASAI